MNRSARAPEMPFVRVGGEVDGTKNLDMAVGEQFAQLECDGNAKIERGAREEQDRETLGGESATLGGLGVRMI